MTTKVRGEKGSWLNRAILIAFVVLLGILLRIETRPRENQPASHESFIAQIAYRR
ncbi:hypothetical protein [Geothrix edaphica]|uniref:Uncharacterized protein n=1 Tax=Geothrix edaphica TaxID=2927976 RepID=A0ABQ5PXS3_9BACT|nr:hypothetical protein [Geothrix edaphica]GLH67171.1 hypothetical protein GETHED_15350 [Geothrix edaphica]